MTTIDIVVPADDKQCQQLAHHLVDRAGEELAGTSINVRYTSPDRYPWTHGGGPYVWTARSGLGHVRKADILFSIHNDSEPRNLVEIGAALGMGKTVLWGCLGGNLRLPHPLRGLHACYLPKLDKGDGAESARVRSGIISRLSQLADETEKLTKDRKEDGLTAEIEAMSPTELKAHVRKQVSEHFVCSGGQNGSDLTIGGENAMARRLAVVAESCDINFRLTAERVIGHGGYVRSGEVDGCLLFSLPFYEPGVQEYVQKNANKIQLVDIRGVGAFLRNLSQTTPALS